MEIAVSSDAATLVRCAATCPDVRGRVAAGEGDPAFLGRLRLRLRRADRFVLPLLRGHFVQRHSHYGAKPEDKKKDGLYLVDVAAGADATRLRRVTGGDAAAAAYRPLSSREGLVLVRMETTSDLVFLGNYVLLVGDGKDGGGAGAVGRPFQVLKARLESTSHLRHRRYMELQTFSSEHGEWGPHTVIRTPHFHGLHLSGEPLVAGGAVHRLWGCWVIKLNVRASRLTATALPESFPWPQHEGQHLLAASPDGSPMVLAADGDKISAWEQSKHTAIWKPRPRVVIENDAILQFNNVAGLIERRPYSPPAKPKLEWFAERSGVELISMDYYGYFWLDLQSMKIVRWFLGPRDQKAYFYRVHFYMGCPLEMDLSSWVPTFSSVL
ncbi:hypothetical protein ACP4OV_007118 [Aristida adscensionis]